MRDRQIVRTALALVALFCLFTTSAEAAGVQRLTVPSDDGSAPLEGAVWYPCAAPPETIEFRRIEMPGVKDCPVEGENLPLIVISHGARGWFAGHHDTAAALADAGYVVAAVTHPDRDRKRWRSARPAAVKRLIDHMLVAWPQLDGKRIGFFGFSRGGYTGLVLIGGQPSFWRLLWHCLFAWSDPICMAPPDRTKADASDAAEDSDAPAPALTHDPRIKAAVIAAPLGVVFSADALETVTVPLQLWRPENDQLLIYPDHAEAVYQALPVKPDYRVVPQAGHFAFLAPCGPALTKAVPAICEDAADFDRVSFHNAFNAAVLAFFQKHLARP